MLNVYTRHLAKCEHAHDIHWRRCRCPKWIRGVLLNGKKIRRSAQTGSWEGAEKQARKLEIEIDPEREKIEARRDVTLREAVKTFLSDQKARGLGKETQKKYRGFLERQYLAWADAHKMKFLVKVSPAELTKFRASWSNGGNDHASQARDAHGALQVLPTKRTNWKKSDGRAQET